MAKTSAGAIRRSASVGPQEAIGAAHGWEDRRVSARLGRPDNPMEVPGSLARASGSVGEVVGAARFELAVFTVSG
jgi:hypothetical protein